MGVVALLQLVSDEPPIDVAAEVAAIMDEFCPDGVPDTTGGAVDALVIYRDHANDDTSVDAVAV